MVVCCVLYIALRTSDLRNASRTKEMLAFREEEINKQAMHLYMKVQVTNYSSWIVNA